MRRTKTEKGITLVALIITIVVLLILAVVAISAIQNDGILSHAQNATGTYNNAVTNEQTMLNKYETYLNDLENGGLPSDLVTYILGADKTGRLLTEVFNFDEWVFIDDTTTEVNEAEIVTILDAFGSNEDNSKAFMYAKYDNAVYRISLNEELLLVIEGSTTTKTDGLKEIYKPQGREGDKVQYDGDNDGTKEDWYIITDRNDKVEIVSANLMGSTLALGASFDGNDRDDSVTVTEDLDGNGKIGNSGDIAIASYNNAITKINNYCNEVVTASDNVRSVGGTNNSATPYSSPNFNDWFKGTGNVASGDIQYEEDLVKLTYHEILVSNGEYWFPSRVVREMEGYIEFSVRSFAAEDGIIMSDPILMVLDNRYAIPCWASLGIRPVVIFPAGTEF